MKKKRIISVILSLILMYLCIIPAFSVTDEVEDYNYEYSEESFQSEYDNNFNKLHFYLSDDTDTADSGIMTLSADNNEESNNHLYIDDADELESAIESMDSYCEKYIDTNEPIELTVEFKTDYENTEEFAEFMKERETVDTIEELRSFRTRLNEFSKEYHRTETLANLEKLEQFDYDNVDIIDYSPFVRLKLDRSEITSENLTPLVDDGAVANVSVSVEGFVGNDATSNDDAVSWNRAMREIEAYSTIHSGLYTGEGIRVGVLEDGVCDISNDNLIDKNISIDANYSSKITEHATTVTSIIALMAPKAEIYSSCYSEQKGLSWFIEQGCDVVNCSFFVSSALDVGDHYNFDINSAIYKYNIDGLFDYHIKANFISAVCSAGNINNDNTYNSYNPYGYVTSPGLAYNAITVGGLDCSLGFFDYNLEHRTTSCYLTVNESAKPEVSAIGSLEVPGFDDACSGTSYAAPQVTGASALLMCKYVQGAINPDAMKALLISGANETEDFSAISGSSFDDKMGAGCISLLNMRECGKISYFYPGVEDYQTNKTVFSYTADFSKNDILQSSVCWFAHAENYMSGEVLLTNYDLQIYDSDNNLVYTSAINNTSCEFIRYKIPSAGSYRIALYQNGPIPEGITEERIAFVYNNL